MGQIAAAGPRPPPAGPDWPHGPADSGQGGRPADLEQSPSPRKRPQRLEPAAAGPVHHHVSRAGGGQGTTPAPHRLLAEPPPAYSRDVAVPRRPSPRRGAPRHHRRADAPGPQAAGAGSVGERAGELTAEGGTFGAQRSLISERDGSPGAPE